MKNFIKNKITTVVEEKRKRRTEAEINPYRSMAKAIVSLVAELQGRTALEVRDEIELMKQTLDQGNVLQSCYAFTYLAIQRTLAMTPHEEQLMAAIAMYEGKVVEMQTGEGKTLAAVFPLVLNALLGRGAHLLTFNDYLAARDAQWMAPVYHYLGLSVGYIQGGMSCQHRLENYARDITYLSAKEAGFDYLRDGLVNCLSDKVHRDLHFALVDEADSILIDEARIPLVIAQSEDTLIATKSKIAELVRPLEYEQHFETDENFRNIFLTEQGAEYFQQHLEILDLYSSQYLPILTEINHALHAEFLLKNNIDYIVQDNQIKLVDEFTGRVAHKRRWPDGLQTALELKEGVAVNVKARIASSVTLQHLLNRYEKLSGMTATAEPAKFEFSSIYGLDILVIPPHCVNVRDDMKDLVLWTKDQKRKKIVEEVANYHAIGRPVLVGTANIEESTLIYQALVDAGIPCNLLNATNDELEADIVADAGRKGAVTISTNMAGRGTDIILGGKSQVKGDGFSKNQDEIKRLGGLHVIGTEKFESSRIDYQLRGRAARQGDPGSSQFIISVEDDLFVKYNADVFLKEKVFTDNTSGRVSDPVILDPVILKLVGRMQRVAEEQNWQIKQTLCKYSHLPEQQRLIQESFRDGVLTDDAATVFFLEKAPEQFKYLKEYYSGDLEDLCRKILLQSHDYAWSNYLAEIGGLKENIHFYRLGGVRPIDEFQKQIIGLFELFQLEVERAALETFRSIALVDGEIVENDILNKSPSSTWTYLINDHFFEDELLDEMIVSGGFAAGMAGVGAPFLMLYFLVKRLFKKGSKFGV